MPTNRRKPIQMSRRGQSFVANFRHPIRKKVVYLNLGNASEAEENLRALNAIFLDERNWRNLPEGTPALIRAAWLDLTPVPAGKAPEVLADIEADYWRRLYEQEAAASALKDQELTALRGRHYGGPTQTLEQALTNFTKNFDTPQRDDVYRKTVLSRLNAFVSAFGKDSPLSDLYGQEPEIRAWVERRGCKVGGMRQWRMALIRFLEESGLRISRRNFRGWRSAKEPIIWMSHEQITQLTDCLCAYGKDLFELQLETGLRPTELPTIKSTDIHDRMLVLSPILPGLTLKQGTRTLPLTDRAKEILDRRLAGKRTIAFTTGKKPWPSQRWFCLQYRTWLDEAKASAEAKPGANPLPAIDARTGRRTAASLWLRRGFSCDQVAALLGDDARTVRRHYARLLPQEVNL
jgi:integrase